MSNVLREMYGWGITTREENIIHDIEVGFTVILTFNQELTYPKYIECISWYDYEIEDLEVIPSAENIVSKNDKNLYNYILQLWDKMLSNNRRLVRPFMFIAKEGFPYRSGHYYDLDHRAIRFGGGLD